ncbi:MAG: N-acetylmuramoyl-L-alanine amidase [Hyphomonadaceae bacterium]|nr:N-acetylmuramoyl-L-alanine amidase [Hyphomonadaceae bacterium]
MSALRVTDRPSPNFDVRTRAIDLVVLHYTGMQNADIALARLTDPAPAAGKYPGPWQSADTPPDAPLPRVSTHYVVDEAGVVFRLVDEDARAWHAGVSSWRGEGDVNSRAIGIEIVNGGHDFGLPDFPEAQIEAVIALVRDILHRRKLSPASVVAHSDIAPERKLDPGEKFPWKRLAEAGVSLWPAPAPLPEDANPVLALQERLARIGYAVQGSGAIDPATKAALAAFQRRFRPERIDGAADEETRALVAALARQLG